MMATRSPQEILEDRKVRVALNDLNSETNEALESLSKLERSASVKALDQRSKTMIKGTARDLERSASSFADEHDRCEEGKSKDTRKLKSLVESYLDDLDDLQELIGRLEALEDSDMAVKLATFASIVVLANSSVPAYAKLRAEAEALSKELEKVQREVKDAAIKAAIGAFVAAVSVWAAPVSVVTVSLVAVAGFVASETAEAVFTDSDDPAYRKAMDGAEGMANAAAALDRGHKLLGKAIGALAIVHDIGKIGVAGFDWPSMKKRLSKLEGSLAALTPQVLTVLAKLEKMAREAQAAVKAARADIASFRGAKSGYHHLPKMLSP